MLNNSNFLENIYLNLNEYLLYMDYNFFDQLKLLIDDCKQKVCNPIETQEEIIEQLQNDEGLSIEEAINLTRAFFRSLGTSYENRFEDVISNNKITFSKGELSASDESQVMLTGNYIDVAVIAHESEHVFSKSDNYSIINALLCEVDSICMEMLAIDYLKENINANKDIIYKAREMDLREEDFFSNKYIETVISLFKNSENNNTNTNTDRLESAKKIFTWEADDDYFEYCFKKKTYVILRGFSHQIGFILANYIHEKILENPENIQMLEAVTKAMNEKNEEKAIEILANSGIPIIENGTISFSNNSIEKLVNALDKSSRRRNNIPIKTLVTEAINGFDFSKLKAIDEHNNNKGEPFSNKIEDTGER